MIKSEASLYAVKYNHLSGHHITDHCHEEAQLTIAVSGTVRVQTESGWWLALPGMAILIPPGVIHRAVYPQQAELINLHFNFGAGNSREQQLEMFTVSTLMLELAREACLLSFTNVESPELSLIRQLMICQLEKNVSQSNFFIPEGQDKRLRFITQKLKNTPGCTDTLSELAEQSCASQRTIARLFLNETGMTFLVWRERLRIIAAVEKLIAGESVLGTALDLGYQSASSFTTAFTRIVGDPPRKYTRRCKSIMFDCPMT